VTQQRITKTATRSRRVAEEVEKLRTPSKVAENAAAEMDDLLDEIDTVLEENAQAFVEGFVQQSGE